MERKIRAMFIFEMIGKPPEYVKESLEEYIKNLEADGVRILSKKIHEPKVIDSEKENGFYSTFGEVELEVDNLNLLFGIEFRMLPSHVEILEPTELELKNFDLAAIMSDLAIKLHKYDEVAKILMIEKNNLEAELNSLKRGLIKFSEIRKNENSDGIENNKNPKISENKKSKLKKDGTKQRKV